MTGRTPPARSDSYLATSAWDVGYTNSLFELDFHNNPSADQKVKRIQNAFYIWTTDFNNTDKQIDGFKSDTKDCWTEVYQLIGFFSVFQGVLFQGLAQLTSQLSCRFYKIPFALSLLASIATVVGAHVKLSKIRGYRKGFFRAKIRSKVLETRIRECREAAQKDPMDLQSIDFKKIEVKANMAVDKLTQNYEGQLGSAHRERVIVLALLAIFSGLFAWLNQSNNVSRIHLMQRGSTISIDARFFLGSPRRMAEF